MSEGAQAAAAPATPAAGKKQTEYLVLALGDEGGHWLEKKKVKARSPRAAVSAIMAELGPTAQGGTFVAVPTRSWEPVTVKTETQTKLVFS